MSVKLSPRKRKIIIPNYNLDAFYVSPLWTADSIFNETFVYMQFTKNFTYDELTRSATAKKHGYDNTPGVDDIRNLQSLCDTILQPIRDRFGQPIIVSSGYRCPALNKAVGGVPHSDHMYGCAADIHPSPRGGREGVKALFDLIVSMINDGTIEVKQCIDEKNYDWIHISYQDGRTSKRNQILHLK